MKYTQKEYEDAIENNKEKKMDFSNVDLRLLTDLTPDQILDNLYIEEISFKNAKLPKLFIKQIVSSKGSYEGIFADMFGLGREVDFSGVDFSSIQLDTIVGSSNFEGFIIDKARFKWDNGKIDTVEHRAWRSNTQMEDLEKKVDAILDESAIHSGDDSKIESLATQLKNLFETHPFVTRKYYFTYDDGVLKDLRSNFEKYKRRVYKVLESDYSLGRKLKRFFPFGRKASQMLNELKSEIRLLKRDVED